MDTFWKCLVCFGIFSSTVHFAEAKHSLVKRNAFQLCNLVNLYTNRSCWKYNHYGCFCGYGQQGAHPTDQADRCCKEHDDCYGIVNDGNFCFFWRGVFVGYEYTCQGTTCSCTDRAKCSRKVCECDLKLAQCLGSTGHKEEFMDFDRSQCRYN